MKTFKVALIENEKEEQEKMKQMFSTFSEEHDAKFVLSTFANGHEFLFDFRFGDYDIILMDIDLGDDFDGIKISIQKVNKSLDEGNSLYQSIIKNTKVWNNDL